MVTWKVKGFFKADAETVYKEIAALGDSFSPEQIVEAARALLLAGIVRAEDKRDAVDDDGAAEIDDEFGIVMLPVTP